VTALVGRQLALAAHPVLREHDADRQGLRATEIATLLDDAGIEIGGSEPRSVLGSAMNNARDLFEPAPGSRWLWIEPVEPKGPGLSGRALAEEAYRLAMLHDPTRQGLHYGKLSELLRDEGVIIRGGNPGRTVFASLQQADNWFEWVSSGTFRWKL
jgi:hypothetical protein